jgi:hypothetical protein
VKLQLLGGSDAAPESQSPGRESDGGTHAPTATERATTERRSSERMSDLLLSV